MWSHEGRRSFCLSMAGVLLLVLTMGAFTAAAQGDVFPYSITRTVADWTYYPGEVLTIGVTVTSHVAQLEGDYINLHEVFPPGWEWIGFITDSPFLNVDPGENGAYIGIDFRIGDTSQYIQFPFHFEYEVNVPTSESGLKQIIGDPVLYLGQESAPLEAVYTSLVPPDGAPLDEVFIEQLQRQGEEEGWTFTVSLNPATQQAPEDLAGTDESFRPLDKDVPIVSFPKAGAKALPLQYDLRNLGGNVPIRNQGGCGSCWAFALIGVAEVMIGVKQGQFLDFSEQWVLSCNNQGFSCAGGWNPYALLYGPDKCGLTGMVLESSLPYQAVVGACPCGVSRTPYPFSFVGQINESLPFNDKTNAIKQAMVSYGPLWTTVRAGYSAFFAYSGGTFNACLNDRIDHAVVLVGWDDNISGGAWIVRNSWGSGWGNQGYMYIRYGCSLIGSYTHVLNYTGGPTTGGIRVNLSPADAVNNGAGWKIDGGATQVSGATVSNLAPGLYTISYTNVPGYTAPPTEMIGVNAGQTTQLNRQYTAVGPTFGALQVTLGPPAAITAGARWSINGGAPQNSGATVGSLTPGQYTISYSFAAGYTAPGTELVQVVAGQTTQLNRQYILQGGGTWIRTPMNLVVNYGNCWNRNGYFRVSGASKIRVGLGDSNIEQCCDKLSIGSDEVAGSFSSFVTADLNQDTISLNLRSDSSAPGYFTIAYVEHQGPLVSVQQSGAVFGSGDDCGNDCGGSKILNKQIDESFEPAAGGEVMLELDPSVSALPPLIASEGSKPYRLSPAGTFSAPVALELPLAPQLQPGSVALYYMSETPGQEGWYRAENVSGLLASENVVPITREDGQMYLQFMVNHGGVFQLGIPIPAHTASVLPTEISAAGNARQWMILSLTCMLLLAGLGIWQRKASLSKDK